MFRVLGFRVSGLGGFRGWAAGLVSSAWHRVPPSRTNNNQQPPTTNQLIGSDLCVQILIVLFNTIHYSLTKHKLTISKSYTHRLSHVKHKVQILMIVFSTIHCSLTKYKTYQNLAAKGYPYKQTKFTTN